LSTGLALSCFLLNIVLFLILHEEMGGKQGHSVALAVNKGQDIAGQYFYEKELYSLGKI
jgi:hypothetical protein